MADIGSTSRKLRAKLYSPFRCFNSSAEVIRLVVLMYVRFPLSLRNVEDLLHERGIDICHVTVRVWWHRFAPLLAADSRRQRVSAMRGLKSYGAALRTLGTWPGGRSSRPEPRRTKIELQLPETVSR